MCRLGGWLNVLTKVLLAVANRGGGQGGQPNIWMNANCQGLRQLSWSKSLSRVRDQYKEVTVRNEREYCFPYGGSLICPPRHLFVPPTWLLPPSLWTITKFNVVIKETFAKGRYFCGGDETVKERCKEEELDFGSSSHLPTHTKLSTNLFHTVDRLLFKMEQEWNIS